MSMIENTPSFKGNYFKEGFAYRIHVGNSGKVLDEIVAVSLCDFNADHDGRMWFSEGMRHGMTSLFKCLADNNTTAVFITIDLHSIIEIRIKADWCESGDVVIRSMMEVE